MKKDFFFSKQNITKSDSFSSFSITRSFLSSPAWEGGVWVPISHVINVYCVSDFFHRFLPSTLCTSVFFSQRLFLFFRPRNQSQHLLSLHPHPPKKNPPPASRTSAHQKPRSSKSIGTLSHSEKRKNRNPFISISFQMYLNPIKFVFLT